MLLSEKRIFIVDDNVENRVIMQMLLEHEGAKIAFDRWGKDSVRRLQRFAPVDVILLDLMLPNNVTGYDIFDQIRALTEYDYVPIVAVSSSEPSQAIPKAKEKGFAGYITKPILFDLFPKQIADIVSGEQIWLNK